ncbi:hypothetical protein TFUB22_02002 [Tannerella forsythia]|nr:hypothetical protein TFUB22_02002 [Tannerella forsythia]
MKTFYLCILLWTSGCLLVSGQTVRVFDNERICFDPNLYQKITSIPIPIRSFTSQMDVSY